MILDLDMLYRELRRDEGERLAPYRDSKGILTVGCGHNLEAKGISKAVSDLMLREDVEDAMRDLDTHLPWWRDLDPVRQRVLVNLAFNMGMGVPGGGHGLLSFVSTLACIRAGQYQEAAVRMCQSKWARDVGPRADRLARMMQTGGIT